MYLALVLGMAELSSSLPAAGGGYTFARRALGLVRQHVTWQGDPLFAGNPFFAGEVEPCINGQTAAAGAYFGQEVSGLIGRLLTEQLR